MLTPEQALKAFHAYGPGYHSANVLGHFIEIERRSHKWIVRLDNRTWFTEYRTLAAAKDAALDSVL